MKTKIRSLTLSAFMGALPYIALPMAAVPSLAFANTETASFPDLESLVHYTTVRRGVTREHMLTTQTAIDAIQAGQPIPTGTHIVLVDHQHDVLARYLVAEKQGDGPDDWAYQAYTPERELKTDDESPARCYSCHQSRQSRQYMFTYNDARSFTP
ncbi:cytochrome P460 family protein [Pseudomonas sp. NPDC078700]|uniref:cytochrome P460 family protein n=1 Tax=Pseudomonas sp. NPDC078700 TaxID=3364424 RepID=UPI0037CC1995